MSDHSSDNKGKDPTTLGIVLDVYARTMDQRFAQLERQMLQGRQEQDKRIEGMGGELEELKREVQDIREKDLPDLRNQIIKNQNDTARATLSTIVKVQASILLAVLGVVVTLITKVLFRW